MHWWGQRSSKGQLGSTRGKFAYNAIWLPGVNQRAIEMRRAIKCSQCYRALCSCRCSSIHNKNIAQFQKTVLVSFWFGMVLVGQGFINCLPRSLLLCPFHKKLRIWWKKFFGFCQTDNPRFRCIVYCYIYCQLIRKNLEVSEFSTSR